MDTGTFLALLMACLNMAMSFGGHSVHITQNWAVIQKWLIVQ